MRVKVQEKKKTNLFRVISIGGHEVYLILYFYRTAKASTKNTAIQVKK